MAEQVRNLIAKWSAAWPSPLIISRQRDNGQFRINLVDYPEPENYEDQSEEVLETISYYLTVWMKQTEAGEIEKLAPIQLPGPYWRVYSPYTQLVQCIKFQFFATSSVTGYIGHSAIFTGLVLDSLEEDGEDIGVIPAEMWDAYKQYIEDKIIAAGVTTIDPTLSIQGAAADAKAAGDAVAELNGRLSQQSDILEITTESHEPINLFDGVYTGVIPPASASGSDTANANNSTSDFISAEYGDTIVCGYTGNVESALTTYNPTFVTEYDENKNWLLRSSQFPATGTESEYKKYTVANANTKFVRVSFANTMVTTSGRLFEILKNADVTQYIYYSEYFAPYTEVESKRLKSIENQLHAVDKKIIDCWGDSRTEMIAGQGTSYCDYLQSLLGDTFNVCNYGESSQSSGMCAARLGSNEVFVTITGNQIPASGEVLLTGIKCSSGNNRNLYAYSASSFIPCMLNGVRGRLTRSSISTYDNVKFIRDSDGSAVSVKPRSKAVVPNMESKSHICVLWWGKNDFDSAGNYVVSGILDNYKKAVEYIGHNYFIILGETCSINSNYETGGSYRTKLDAINTELAAKYPDNYIDINAWLSSEDALTSVGLTATATDREYISKGWPCYQLMTYSTSTSDTVHPNEKGREAIANRIYAWMQEHNWI